VTNASPDPAPPPAGRPRQTPGSVQYKGAPLEAERGPGLGCFWIQLALLSIAVVVTPLSVAWSWPSTVSAVLLIVVILLLFLTGQTVIFLLRLVAAERRGAGRRRPLASATRTVGELEDERRQAASGSSSPDEPQAGAEPDEQGRVRQ
jgi:hypothetical protein